MKYAVCVVLLGLLGVAALMYSAGLFRGGDLSVAASEKAARNEDLKQGEKPKGPPPLVVDNNEDQKQGEKPKAPPPLVVDKNAPLLLADPPKEDPFDVPTGPVADNTACFVCHTNYEEEQFAREHAEADVGCVECHGESYAHRDDEDNITPPDVMFWPEKIASNCEECHEDHNAPAVDVILRWQDCCPEKTDPEKILCTDCHGQHRLKLRTVRWDKRTGKLIVRPEGQPLFVAPDSTRRESGNE